MTEQGKKICLVDATTWRFLLVGVINTLVGEGAMFLLYNLVRFPYWWAVCSNYVLGGICSFFLNKYFTFQNHQRSWRQAFRFVATLVASAVPAYCIARPLARIGLAALVRMFTPESGTQVFSQAVIDNAAMFLGIALYTIINFILQKLWVFQKTPDK